LEQSGIELDESLLEEEPSLPRRIATSNSSLSLDTLSMNGDTPQTYRGMIKITLESMGGEANFEAISKYIGTRFKEQLNSKAETWKHSIAGCLSVYFARKEEKDPSGKVIWTLGAPPKPKRRVRRRDRNPNDMDLDRDMDDDDRLSPSPERTVSKGKRKKEETINITLEHLEALEEENECLKLLVAKKKRSAKEEHTLGEACSACRERRELCMVLNPCGHLFCGSIFCDASGSKQCMICRVDVSSRLPVRINNKDNKEKNLMKVPATPISRKESTNNVNGNANANVNGNATNVTNGTGNANSNSNGAAKPQADFGNGLLSFSSIVSEERVPKKEMQAPS